MRANCLLLKLYVVPREPRLEDGEGFCKIFVDTKTYYRCKDFLKLSVYSLKRLELSRCHPPRHPFTSRMRQWQASENNPFPPAAFWVWLNQSEKACACVRLCFWPGTPNHRGSSTPDTLLSVYRLSAGSGWCGPLHRCCGSEPLFWPPANQIHCFISRHMWPGRLWVLAFGLAYTFASVLACICAAEELYYPCSHNALLPYQQASLTLFLASSSSWASTIGTVLPPQQAEGLCNKRRLKIKKIKTCLWTNKDD